MAVVGDNRGVGDQHPFPGGRGVTCGDQPVVAGREIEEDGEESDGQQCAGGGGTEAGHGRLPVERSRRQQG